MQFKGILNLSKYRFKNSFRPQMPKSWSKNNNTWLSTSDIETVLKQYEELHILEEEISKTNIDKIDYDLLLEAKQKGFADRQIAYMLGCLESEVYNKRDELDIKRVYKLVDTCAAEFPAQTPYYYSTFEEKIKTNKNTEFSENESSVSD